MSSSLLVVYVSQHANKASKKRHTNERNVRTLGSGSVTVNRVVKPIGLRRLAAVT